MPIFMCYQQKCKYFLLTLHVINNMLITIINSCSSIIKLVDKPIKYVDHIIITLKAIDKPKSYHTYQHPLLLLFKRDFFKKEI